MMHFMAIRVAEPWTPFSVVALTLLILVLVIVVVVLIRRS
jgi:hypothetical protein